VRDRNIVVTLILLNQKDGCALDLKAAPVIMKLGQGAKPMSKSFY